MSSDIVHHFRHSTQFLTIAIKDLWYKLPPRLIDTVKNWNVAMSGIDENMHDIVHDP